MKRCYMILFESGLVKVGYADPLCYRIAEHKRQARMHGNNVVKIWFSEKTSSFLDFEQKLIKFCSESFEKISSEYFTGASEVICDYVIKSVELPFIKCNDVVNSTGKDSFLAEFDDYQKDKKSKEDADQVNINIDSVMIKVKELIEKNKGITKGILVNRMRPTAKTKVVLAIDSLMQANLIEREKISHNRNNLEVEYFFCKKNTKR